MYTLNIHKPTFQELLKLINKTNKMATKKKTTKPKTYTLTEKQFEILREVSDELYAIKSSLHNQTDEDSLSAVMFNIGKIHIETGNCEDKLNDVIGSFEDDSDDLSW